MCNLIQGVISDDDDDVNTDNKDQLRDMEFKLTHDLTQLQVSCCVGFWDYPNVCVSIMIKLGGCNLILWATPNCVFVVGLCKQ